jgi:broad specificity phosphatase PhoE
MVEPIRIYFMRHAASEANAQEVVAGRCEFPLTARSAVDTEVVAAAFVSSRDRG